MTMPPHMPGSRRVVPAHPTADEVKRVRALIEQGQFWVLRPAWDRYLGGRAEETVPIDGLTRDRVVAVLSWLRQQRHHLYRVIEGGWPAPAGWIEQQPLYRAFLDRSRSRTA